MNYVVIPAFNEERTIKEVVDDVQKLCSSIVVVDDGSEDGTFESAKAAGALALRHIVNRGQGAALATGIAYALSKGADIIITFDADGQHDAEDIIPLIASIEERGEIDVVLGSRFIMSNVKYQMSNMPFTRLITLKLAQLHQWFFTGLKVTDTHCGLRAFSRIAAEKIRITQDRMAHASEILEEIARHKLSFIEVPVHVRYTAYSLEKGQRGLMGSIKILYDFFVGRLLIRER